MGDMLIRGIPDTLKTALEDAARQDGRSLSSRAIDLLRKGLLFEKERLRPGRGARRAGRFAGSSRRRARSTTSSPT